MQSTTNKKFQQNIWAHNSKNLAWKAYIKAMKNTAMRRLVVLSSIFKCRTLRRKLKTHLYRSLIRPILLYGAPAWGYEATNNMKNLQVIVNKIIRSIYAEADHSGSTV
jgi:hypothetical protein